MLEEASSLLGRLVSVATGTVSSGAGAALSTVNAVISAPNTQLTSQYIDEESYSRIGSGACFFFFFFLVCAANVVRAENSGQQGDRVRPRERKRAVAGSVPCGRAHTKDAARIIGAQGMHLGRAAAITI